MIDLMLYYVETGVKYTREYGDIDEPFYNSMENMYASALELIEKLSLHRDFYARCKKIVTNTEGIGWGFYDNLSYLFEKYFKQIRILVWVIIFSLLWLAEFRGAEARIRT